MLQQLLKKHHTSRSELANALGVSHQTIANWASGRVQAPLAQLEPLARYFRSKGAREEEVAELSLGFLLAHGVDPSVLAGVSRSVGGLSGAHAGSRPVLVMTWDLGRTRFYGALTRLTISMLEHFGYRCLLVDCCGQHGIKRYYAKMAVSTQCAGVLMVGVPGEPPDSIGELNSVISTLVAGGVPVALVAGAHTREELLPNTVAISWDLRAGVNLMVGALADYGHRKIGAILPYSGLYLRYDIFESALHRHGLEPDERSCAWPYEGDSILGNLEPVVRQNTGVITTPTGLEFLVAECYKNNLLWPDDLSIITTAGSAEHVTRRGTRPFTYVSMPFTHVGHVAAQMLSRLMQQRTIPPEEALVEFGQEALSMVNLQGGSVGAPRVKQPLLADNLEARW